MFVLFIIVLYYSLTLFSVLKKVEERRPVFNIPWVSHNTHAIFGGDSFSLYLVVGTSSLSACNILNEIDRLQKYVQK